MFLCIGQRSENSYGRNAEPLAIRCPYLAWLRWLTHYSCVIIFIAVIITPYPFPPPHRYIYIYCCIAHIPYLPHAVDNVMMMTASSYNSHTHFLSPNFHLIPIISCTRLKRDTHILTQTPKYIVKMVGASSNHSLFFFFLFFCFDNFLVIHFSWALFSGQKYAII